MLARISSLLTRVSTSMMALQSASNEVFGNVTLRMNLQAEGLSALSELWVEQPDQAALWPCGGQPSWNGATHPSLISLSAPDETDLDDIATAVRLGATEIEKSRFRRKLVRLAGVDALLPSAAEMRGATCPPKSMMLQYLNSSMPADERPRVVSDDGGPSWTEVGTLQSKVPVLALLALAGNTSKHGGSSTRQERERMLLVEAPMERGLRAPVSKGSLELWWWWWGPWWWWWRWWFWWWRPPKVRLEVSVNGQKPLPDRVYPSDKLMICIDVKDHWFTMPMVVALQPQEGNLPKCLFSPWYAPTYPRPACMESPPTHRDLQTHWQALGAVRRLVPSSGLVRVVLVFPASALPLDAVHTPRHFQLPDGLQAMVLVRRRHSWLLEPFRHSFAGRSLASALRLGLKERGM